MTWWERWAFNGLHVVVSVTGVAYLVMKHLLVADDPFAVVNHPWQPWVLSTHVVAAPVWIVFFGMLFRSHTLRKLTAPNPTNRRSGWASLVSFSTMALSAYLLQVAAAPALIAGFTWLHVSSSLVFAGVYTTHLVIGLRSRPPSAADLLRPAKVRS